MNPVWGSLTYFVLGEGLYQAGVYPSVDRVDPLNREPVIPGTPHSDSWSLRVPCSFCETPQGLVSVSGRWLKETSQTLTWPCPKSLSMKPSVRLEIWDFL